jgi:hypothetical protein
MKQRKHLVAALWAIALLAAALPALGRARTDRVRIFTTWDSTFFYAAFDVNDPDIQGASRAPNAPVAEGDDAVAVYFHTDRTDPSGLDENAFRMVVSAAGGAEFARGENGSWKLVPITTFKYSVQRNGTLNDDQDDDVGYSVELAIPWKELGIEADIGTALRFNAAIWLAGEHRGFVSLSPDAARAGNLDDPSLWLELWLRGPVQPLLARSEGRVLANRVAIRPPVVDGRISPGEYPEKGMLEVEKPPLAQAVRVFRDIPVESLVFAEYEPDPLGTRPASSLVSKPFGGTGPWTSGLSVAWHRQQMRDALRAGIDALLIRIPAEMSLPAADVAAVALAMAEASGAEGAPRAAPLIVTEQGQTPPAEKLWRVAASLYRQIPVSQRAEVRLPESRGGHACLPVFARGVLQITAEERAACDADARREFGRGLVWVGGPGSTGVDGVLPDPFNANGWAQAPAGEGWIRIGSVTPGFVRPEGSLDHRGQDTLRQAWAALAAQKPDWVVVRTFNGFSDGSAICATSEDGYLASDANALEALRFRGGSELAVTFLSASVAPVIAPGGVSVARVTVRNSGARSWRAAERIQLSYRWYQGGRLYSRGLFTVPLQRDVGIGAVTAFNIGVAAADSDRDPLPEGDWLLVFDLLGPDGRPFSARGARPLAVPVRIGAPPAFAGTALDLSLPPALMSGETATASLTLRNDGTDTWKPGGAQVSILLARASDGTKLTSAAVPLPVEIQPGRIVDVPVTFPVRDSAGRAIAPGADEDILIARVEAAVTRSAQEPGARISATVPLVRAYRGASLRPPDVPILTCTYGTPVRFAIQVMNTGTAVWREPTRLVGRLYSLDGVLLLSEAGEGKMKRGIRPGESVSVPVEFRPPAYPGQYVLRWEVEGGLAGTGLADDRFRGDGVFTHVVTVDGPALEFVDLSTAFDTDVIASQDPLDDARFDEGGAALAAHLMPPLVTPNPSPSDRFAVGLFGDDPPGGPAPAGNPSWRWISFKYPPKGPGMMNAVSAKGQSVTLPGVNCSRVHILAASSDGPKEAVFGLGYADGAATARVSVGSWSERIPGSVVAWEMPGRIRQGAFVAERAWLYNVTLQADAGRPLSSLKLPDDPSIKVLAITLEKAEPAPAGRR